MKKIFLLPILIALCFIFGGCPYESKVPIDSPSVKTNPSLLGNWQKQNDTGDHYVISAKDEYHYLITETSRSSNEVNEYIAYASMVKGTTFINLYKTEAPDSAQTFLLYKLDVKSENEFMLTEVTDNIEEQFTSGKALSKFIASNMGNSYFFNKSAIMFSRLGK